MWEFDRFLNNGAFNKNMVLINKLSRKEESLVSRISSVIKASYFIMTPFKSGWSVNFFNEQKDKISNLTKVNNKYAWNGAEYTFAQLDGVVNALVNQSFKYCMNCGNYKKCKLYPHVFKIKGVEIWNEEGIKERLKNTFRIKFFYEYSPKTLFIVICSKTSSWHTNMKVARILSDQFQQKKKNSRKKFWREYLFLSPASALFLWKLVNLFCFRFKLY